MSEDHVNGSTVDVTSPVTAQTYLRSFSTASAPVLLKCDDGEEYVVKAVQAGRMVFNDHVVGRLGARLEAPVPKVTLVDVPPELIEAQEEMRHMAEGLAHGSAFIPGCTDREGLKYLDNSDNRDRFTVLACLYGWVQANDHQYIYRIKTPNLVYSVDHGHFFPNGPNWTTESLDGAAPPAMDSEILSAVTPNADSLTRLSHALQSIGDDEIAADIQAPPDEWGVDRSEREAVTAYLIRRRDELAEVLQEELDD